MSDKAHQGAREIAEFVEGLLRSTADDATAHIADFLAEIEQDIAELWTVPPERQERYLRRIELQIVALVEIQRIRLVSTTKRGLASAITHAIRLALRLLV